MDGTASAVNQRGPEVINFDDYDDDYPLEAFPGILGSWFDGSTYVIDDIIEPLDNINWDKYGELIESQDEAGGLLRRRSHFTPRLTIVMLVTETRQNR